MRTAASTLALTLSLLAACTIGENSNPGGGNGDGMGDGDGNGDGGDGALPPDAAIPADAAVVTGTLEITGTASPTGIGQYAPNHVLAVWLEGPGGTFVKTIDRQAQVRTAALVAWRAKAGNTDVDAVSGATRPSYGTPFTITSDLLDRAGAAEIPDGTYTVRMESSDLNAVTANQNNQGTFTFIKGPAPQAQTALTSDGFAAVSITYTPAP